MHNLVFKKSGLRFLTLACLGLPLASGAYCSSGAVRAWRGHVDLPTYPWASVKHPYFRGTDGVNIYPYPMQDFLSRNRTNRTYRTVVLENDYLRITFLPELGGKIHEVIDKTTGQPMFYVNHVVKPALIGQCGAWTSGGVEWNTGPQGHTVSCMQPVDVVILPRAGDGSRSVAIGETERIYGTKWTVIVTLKPDRSFIEEHIRIYNPTETVRPYYFWNCTAVPNTKGFRFIYPMSLGTDHGAERFFNWPIHEGTDLSRGTNYHDAASIFAWECNQDFFGSYNDDLDRGVVACANHHILPGKKAWTWGWGSYGTMHQADLTDSDGPYNEVQTGPLITQAEVGRLDPCEAVSWQEWWFPVHGLAGFDYANTNLAARIVHTNNSFIIKLLGTAKWPEAILHISSDDKIIFRKSLRIDQVSPAEVFVPGNLPAKVCVEVLTRDGTTIAKWPWPLDIPTRAPPLPKKPPETVAELVTSAWQHYLLARHSDSERDFNKALQKDPQCPEALIGLAYVELDRAPLRSVNYARRAIAIRPDSGEAYYVLAVASSRLWLEEPSPDLALRHLALAIDAAWKAVGDPATMIPARALLAKLLIKTYRVAEAVQVLSEPGPWQADSTCQGLLAYCLCEPVSRNKLTSELSQRLAAENLEVDPLDLFARLILAANKSHGSPVHFDLPEGTDEKAVFQLLAQLRDLGATELLASLILRGPPASQPHIRTARNTQGGQRESSPKHMGFATPRDLVEEACEPWPWRYSDLQYLRSKLANNPNDGRLVLALGHLLFHLGRHEEARQMWMRARALGFEVAIANRALGMAALTLDNNPQSAVEHLTAAHKADPQDPIIARDLAKALHRIADASDSDTRRQEMFQHARAVLMSAFEQGKGRSDFVALLARSLMKLGDCRETAKLLDNVRITIWEGAREAHDLFEEAHLALGEEHLKAGRPAEALAEFNRALEYPPNLATGRLENAREAHIHYLQGKALAALGRHSEAIAAWKLAAEEPPSGDPRKDSARENARREMQAHTAQ